MKSVIQIEGMSCKRCVAHVASLVQEVLPSEKFLVSLENKSVLVQSDDSALIEKIKKTINDDGIYKAN